MAFGYKMAKSRRISRKKAETQDLSYITGLGAGLRRNSLYRDIWTFSPAVVLAVALQSSCYLALYMRAPQSWHAASLTLAVLALVPLFSAATLSAFRRNEAPVVAAAVAVATFFSFAVTFLSALRIHVSFAGLALALPVTMLIIAVANARFHKRLTARVALAAFDGDTLPLSLLAVSRVARITDPSADITEFDTVLIDPTHHHTREWSSMLSRCYVAGVDVMPWAQFLEIREGRVHVSAFEVSHLAYSPSQMLYARSKRLLDLAAVFLTLPVTLPLAAFTALYIFLRDGAPVLFVQHRRGFAGRVFRMYKFRTMYKGTGGGSTSVGDTRIIPGCTLVRKLRLDELPQLYNVLLGDMSLIGPRPVAEYVAKSTVRSEPKYALRNLVAPGLTGWAQVTSGYAESTDEEVEKLAYDLYYIKHLSFDLDLQVLFKTIKTIVLAAGAR
ncbi:sugar transferase [Pelagibacterium sp. 26DY04]|uniref:sugar transferase n=1 Tax=Pelagibacterium sp. 26DY04 TaxID=2967130 RepID=UPI002815CF55|nr:sugar transferase [Pelagibacterium sp. 26DY04]WMT87473.1 sugar transferase [Pelagibacterium sp. 26DY04]